jgi:ABC-type antimicrobial peptide transport system permease subunit
VVGNVKDNGPSVRQPQEILYQPLAQRPVRYQTLVVRTALPPRQLVGAVTQAVRDVDREQPVRQVRTMDDLFETALSQQRFNMLLLAAFAGIAVVLAAVGIYSVLAYAVKRRAREIGLRVALGASRSDVLRLVILEGMRPTLAGIALGLFGAVALSEVLNKLVFGVSPSDPRTFAAVSLLMALIAAAACLFPGLRATALDPIQVLRDD